MVTALVLLNLAGRELAEDLRVLEKDEGFCRVLRKVETYGLGRRERRRYFGTLGGFLVEEGRRLAHTVFIPSPNPALQGLGRDNGQLLAFVQSRSPMKQATLDMDATLVETQKEEALPSYRGYQAYQPPSTYWAEQELLVHSEFRDGNVPAGYQQLRVLQEALELLPSGVEQVYLRSDTAGYQTELLRYCGEGQDQPLGVIEFAVGVDLTVEFKKAVGEVGEEEWHPLERRWGAGKSPRDSSGLRCTLCPTG